jgi:hypothetical protein
MKLFSRLLLLFLLISIAPLALFGYFNLQQDEATVLIRLSHPPTRCSVS